MKRKSILTVQPKAYQAMRALESYMHNTGLDKKLCELIKVRASQLNQCAYCIDMHTEEAVEAGESARRLFAVSAWKESPLFNEQEKIALQLTEEVTLIGNNGVTDNTYHQCVEVFGDEKTAQIIMQIVIINSWNRLMIAGAETYVSKHEKQGTV